MLIDANKAKHIARYIHRLFLTNTFCTRTYEDDLDSSLSNRLSPEQR